MKKIIILITLLAGIACLESYAQKRYGYTILHFKCGNNDSQRDRVFYSPVIELNTLNFPKYTEGMDPAFGQYSVRYYNYAISKWFEIYLKDKYNIFINSADKYARKSINVVYNDKNKAGCNDEKTNSDCFFMNKETLSIMRNNAIIESRSPKNNNDICEVIDLK